MKIDKITIKFIKYFLSIMSGTILLCFLVSSLFLSKYYINQQYNALKNSSQNIYETLSSGQQLNNLDIPAFLIRNDTVTYLGKGKMMGLMSLVNNSNLKVLSEKGKLKNPLGEEFLYYNLKTDIGDIIVFQNSKFSSDYLKIVYIILFVIFLVSVALSIPLISYIGKKFTLPILELKKASIDISNGNFDTKIDIHTDDEVEELSLSIKSMSLKLKERDTLQKDFIANISHDFKTPLSVIRSYNEAIADSIVDGDKARSMSRDVISEVDRLNNLVMDLLELSKLQDGNLTIKKEDFLIGDFINDCVNRLNVNFTKKNISICVNSINAKVYGDRDLLFRVLYNFIDNAIKFSHQSSKIEVNALKYENKLRISVKDYGCGIEKDFQNNIWERYTKDSQKGGVGLGLPICSEILKLHNYSYGVISEPQIGSEFFFNIPINQFTIDN